MPIFDMTARCFEGDVSGTVQFTCSRRQCHVSSVFASRGSPPLRAHARGMYGFQTVSRQFNDSFPTVADTCKKGRILGVFGGVRFELYMELYMEPYTLKIRLRGGA